MPPTTPGRTAPGIHNSIVRPRMPRLSRMYAMFGCASVLSTRWRKVIARGSMRAPAVQSVSVRPSNRLMTRPSSFASRSGRSEATRSMSGGVAFRASVSVNARLSFTACSAHSTWRPRPIASVLA